MDRAAAVSMTRRRIIGVALTTGIFASVGGIRRVYSQTDGPYLLPPLPYPENALAPVISSSTISFHYGKHHAAYVANLNKAISGTDLAGKPLEEIVQVTAGDPKRVGIFNNAAQDWNHTLYWNCMRPRGGGRPSGAIADRINESFGDYDKFRQAFVKDAVTQFGSGWAWLVQNKDKMLEVVATANADTPMAREANCQLTCDVWEHAYYLDYQNRRSDYVNAWLDKLVNWEFTAQRLAA